MDTCIHIYTHYKYAIFMYIFIYIHIYVYAYVYVCMCVCVSACMSVYICVENEKMQWHSKLFMNMSKKTCFALGSAKRHKSVVFLATIPLLNGTIKKCISKRNHCVKHLNKGRYTFVFSKKIIFA